MKIYQKIAGQPVTIPALRRDKQGNGVKVPIGSIVHRWETITKLQLKFGFLRNDLDESRYYCDGFDLSSPSDVTWFYIEEEKPTFLTNWQLIDSYPDPLLTGVQGPLGATGPQGPIDSLIIEQWVGVPISQNSTGLKGQEAFDGTNLYKCVEDNVWVKFAVITSF